MKPHIEDLAGWRLRTGTVPLPKSGGLPLLMGIVNVTRGSKKK